MKLETLVGALRRRTELRQRVEGYAISALFHILLLLLLATITISASGNNFGFGLRPRGAKVQLAFREETVDDTNLEDLVENVDVKPIEVERIQPRQVALPELSSFAAPRPSSERLARVSTRFSPATGVGGLTGDFGSFIFGLRKTGLDVALVIDATASMKYVIQDIKARVSALVHNIQDLVPIARVGVVAFRDKGEEFTVRWTDLSFHASKVQTFIKNLKAEGGGDYEEGVREGLETAIDELSWRKRSKRVIILIGSSPPHKEDIAAVEALAKEFHDAGGVVSTIDLTQRMHEEYEKEYAISRFGKPPAKYSPLPPFYQDVRHVFADIAHDGGGDIASLGSDAQLTDQILTFAFGSRWEKEVARYTKDQ